MPRVSVTYQAAGAVAIASLLAIGAALRLPDPLSGADGGNWLALSHEFAGQRANAAGTVYPPAFHFLLFVLQFWLPPLQALRVLGTVVAMLPGLSGFALLRALRCGPFAFAGLCISLTGFSLEMLSWGGYPQLMATGLALGGFAALNEGFRRSSTRHLVLAGALGGATLLTHHLVAAQLVAAMACTCGIALVQARNAWRARLQEVAVVGGIGLVCSLGAAPTYIALLTRAGASSFNANGFDYGGIAEYLTNEAPAFWFALSLAVPVAVGIRVMQRAWLDLAAYAGLTVASVVAALLTNELRFAYLAQTLVIASAATVFVTVCCSSSRPGRVLVSLAACAFFGVLIAAGVQRFDRSVRFYAVLDPSLVDGLEWLAHNHRGDDLAVVTPGLGRWPLGWWVQGLGRVPSYLDYDPRWLYFREEKAQAEIAQMVLDQQDPQQAAELARAYGISLIVMDSRISTESTDWLHSGRVTGPIGLVYANPSLAIFRVERSAPS